MTNWRRPSNRSSRLTLPLGSSNSYCFSTASHGIRRRSAASASRARVKAFSFTRSCCRAVSHSCGDTIGGVFFARCPLAIVILLGLGWSGLIVCGVLRAEFHHCCCESACRSDATRNQHGGCYAHWTHGVLPPSAS